MRATDREARARWQIKKYDVKTNAASTGQMYGRFNEGFYPNSGYKFGKFAKFSYLSFSFNLNLLLNVDIQINITFPQFIKAQYGTARYGKSLYDPLRVLGVVSPTQVIQEVTLFMLQHFVNSSERGYKYTMPMCLIAFHANEPIFDKFGPDKIWMPRLRRIEAWHNWSAFYGYCMYGAAIYPSKSIYIRVTDNPQAFGYPTNNNIITSDSEEMSTIMHRYPAWQDLFPFPEYYMKTPNLYVYQPVYGCANYGFDFYIGGLKLVGGELDNIIANFKATQNPLYRELQQFTGHARMVMKYGVHSAYQTSTREKLYQLIGSQVDSPLDLAKYYSFMLEYTYKRRLEGLIAGEAVIQKWISYGLSENLLRLITQSILR